MPLGHAGGRLLFIIYYTLFYTKPANLTAGAWPFSIDFNGNSFGCVTKKCMRAGDGKLLYYKSWPNTNTEKQCHGCNNYYLLANIPGLVIEWGDHNTSTVVTIGLHYVHYM